MRARLVILVALLVVFIARGVGGCPCSSGIPSNYNCASSSKCATCETKEFSCTCTTGCISGDCGAYGSEYTTFSECYWGCCFAYYDATCLRTSTRTINKCSSCKSGLYGPNCDPCPNGAANPCNANTGNGQCFEGLSGTGACICNEGYAGDRCQYTPADCNNHGQVQNDGSCDCDPGFGGADCTVCQSTSYHGPDCLFCENDASCSGRNIGYQESPRIEGCTSTAECDCKDGYGGSACDVCAADHYPQGIQNPAQCVLCRAEVECENRGTCNQITGECECTAPWASTTGSSTCDACAPGYAGPNCNPCPNGADDPCFVLSGLGTCDDGIGGTGVCTCNPPFVGPDCNDPIVTGINPAQGASEGGYKVTLTGFNFLSAGTVSYLSTPPLALEQFSYDDQTIVVIMSDSYGSESVQVKSAEGATERFSNSDFTFSFLPPTLYAPAVPASGPSADRRITVSGTSFSPSGQLLLDDVALDPSSIVEWQHTQVEFIAPVGVGTGHTIKIVSLDGQPSTNFLTFAYDAPVVSSTTGAQAGTGGGIVTVVGQNFGNSEQPVVTVNGVACTYVSHSNTQIVCNAPAGTGVDNVVSVSVGGQSGDGSVLTYAPPTITAVQGCTNDSSSTTKECPTSGAVQLFISGTNFGTDSGSIAVTVNGVTCTAPNIAAGIIDCVLPAGYGILVPVEVDVDGQATQAQLLSYASPEIFPLTLAASGFPPVLDNGAVLYRTADLTTPNVVEFQGKYFGTDPMQVVVKYGPVEEPSKYTCSVQAVQDNKITCQTEAGVGGNHHFFATVGGIESNIGEDTFAYALPTITPGTLRTPTRPHSDPLEGTSSLGEVLVFDGEFFGLVAEDVSITYAQPGDSPGEPCTLVLPFDPTGTTLSCLTGQKASVNLTFTVTVGVGSSGQEVTGVDQYSYPQAPTIGVVSGCTDDGDLTHSCPTDGLDENGDPLRISITGSFFGLSGASVFVGGVRCLDVQHGSIDPNVEVSAILPPGVGLSRPVVVKQGKTFSRAVPALSYAVPVIDAVVGCTPDVFNNTFDCPRDGNITVTVVGSNFGESNAVVLIGGSVCEDVTHDASNGHGQVTCTLAQGVEVDRPVVLLQNLGEISSNVVLLSYTQCAPGTYSVGSDTACLDCLPGSFTNVPSQQTCVSCSPGRFQPAGGESGCEDCPAGKSQSQPGASNCSVCAEGYAVDTPGAVECVKCPEGTYSVGTANTECESCAPGRAQPLPGQTNCTACAAGRATLNFRQAECQACAGGFATTSTEQTQCAACQPGEQSVLILGSSACEGCPAGTASETFAQTRCPLCPVGKYMNVTGQQTCKLCEPGRFANISGSLDCMDCEPGRFANAQGSNECQDCRPGTANAAPGAIECRACTPGKYTSVGGKQNCDECAEGQINSLNGQLGCSGCAPGRFTNTTGNSACDACPAGRYSEFGVSGSATGCLDCLEGTYSETAGQAVCQGCPAGRKQSLRAKTSCDFCEVGTFRSDEGATFCEECPEGSFANAQGTITCAQCPVGRANNGTQASECPQCVPGRFQPLTGQLGCEECPVTTFVFSSGATECTPCTPGFYGNRTGMSLCSECELGRYNNARQGLSFCKPCLVGSFSDSRGAEACRLCLPGRFNTVNSSEVPCTDCPPGTFQPNAGSSECLPCEAGTFTVKSGQRECTPCAPGRYQPLEGNTTCIDCPAGRARLSSGGTQCEICPRGTYLPTPKQLECLPCSPGSASNDTERITSCEPCAEGKFAGLSGSVECEACAQGRSNPGTGQTQCLPCGEGTAQNDTGASSCVPCEPATAVAYTAAAVCEVCPAGRSAPSSSFRECNQCDPGQYQSQPGSIACKFCEAGKFQTFPGATTCELAPRGSFSLNGSTVPIECPERQVTPNAGMSACLTCDGTASHNEEHTNCVCDIGYYAVATSTQESLLECSRCPLGANCRQKGNVEGNLRAEPGWWLTPNTTTKFSRCLLPEHCRGTDAAGQAICDKNRQGRLCLQCVDGTEANTYLSVCKECPKQDASIAYTVLVSVGVLLLVAAMFYVVIRQDRQTALAVRNSKRSSSSQRNLMRSSTGSMGSLSSPGSFGRTSGLSSGSGRGSLRGSQQGAVSTHIASAEDRQTPNITYKGKILVGFMQIGWSLTLLVEVPWPKTFTAFLQFFSFFNFDFIPWQSIKCSAEVSYWDTYLLATLIPPVVFVFLVAGFLIPSKIMDRRDMRDDTGRRVSRDITRRRFWKLVMFLLFMIYPVISTHVLSMFMCVQSVDGEVAFMAHASTVNCYDSEWMKHLPYGLAMVLVYPIGIPLSFFLVLRWNKKRLNDAKTKLQIGFLYAAYHHDYPYFEIVDMFHKLCMTSMIRFLPNDIIMPGGLVVLTMYILFILLVSPYIRKSDDRLHLLAQGVLFNFVLMGYVLRATVEFELEPKIDMLLSILAIGLMCAVVAVFLLLVVKSIRRMWVSHKRKKRAKGMMSDGEDYSSGEYDDEDMFVDDDADEGALTHDRPSGHFDPEAMPEGGSDDDFEPDFVDNEDEHEMFDPEYQGE